MYITKLPLRIYVAGKWEEREEIRKLQNELRKLGHIITIDWTWHEVDDPGYPSQYAVEDIIGVSGCDCYVGVFKNSHDYKGALVEMGVALSFDRKVYIIGHAIDSCLFVGHPLVQTFDTERDFLKYLKDNRDIE